jgi:hypothetical protein
MELQSICEKHGVSPVPCEGSDKLGIALDTMGKQPINGVRHEAENGTCGWYIWCGEELSEDTDFFKPLHVNHISEYLPEVEPYLSLPPGYRFLIAPGQEDVWLDSSLIGK